jgi:hypothetical protein
MCLMAVISKYHVSASLINEDQRFSFCSNAPLITLQRLQFLMVTADIENNELMLESESEMLSSSTTADVRHCPIGTEQDK